MTNPRRVESKVAVTGHEVVVGWFDHPADLTAYVAERAGHAPAREQIMLADSGWVSEGAAEALRRGRVGDESRVRDAEALVEQLQFAVPAPRSEWVPSRAGAFPIVADAVAGHPESMRRKVVMPSDRSPLRVFVDCASSAAIDEDVMARRGTAVLAFAMLLANERPVELHVFSLQSHRGDRRHAGLAVACIPSAPLDLATACNALSSPGFARTVMYSAANLLADQWCTGNWLGLFDQPRRYLDAARALLGAEPQDLVIGPTFLDDPIAADPVGFVRRAVDEHLTALED